MSAINTFKDLKGAIMSDLSDAARQQSYATLGMGRPVVNEHDEAELRLQCLRQACDLGTHGGDPKMIVDRARQFSDFVLGRRDAEVIAAAKVVAEKVRQEG